jgi:hypothetical protein
MLKFQLARSVAADQKKMHVRQLRGDAAVTEDFVLVVLSLLDENP